MKEKLKEIIKGLTNRKEFKEYSVAEFKGLQEFIAFLIEKELVFVVDWKGESEEGEVIDYIQKRLKLDNVDFKFDDSKLKKKKTELEVGEYFLEQIKVYQKSLSKHNYVISDFFMHSDTFFISVLKKTRLTKLKKIVIDNCYFKKFGEIRGENVVYILDCGNCYREYHMFDALISDPPPTKGKCIKCGKSLFDKNGSPLTKMTMNDVPSF